MLIIVVFAFICSGCMDSDIDANTLLEQVTESQQNIESLAYIETLTMYIGNETRTVEYDVRLKKPDKFRRIERSGSFTHSEIVSNGEEIRIYDPIKNVVLIRNQTPSEKIPEPAIYTFMTNITEKYTIEDPEMESINSTQVYRVKLIPHELDNGSAREYLIWIDSNNLIPLKLQSYYEGNLVLSLEYRNYSINSITNDDEFSFTVPYGASEVYI